MCNRKIRGYIVLSSLVILCLCFVSVVSFFVPQNSARGLTSSGISAAVKVDELLRTGYENETDKTKRIFEGEKLAELYHLLNGDSNATYSDIVSDAMTTKNSDYFRSVNDGADIIIKLGGYEWNVMYLSTNRQDQPILTLWLTDSTQLPTNYQRASFSTYTTSSVSALHPGCIYGTSKVRADTLNNGGTYYGDSNGNSSTTVDQNEENPFAIYTMEDVSGSIVSFIDAPNNVEWQESLSAQTGNFEANGSNYSNNFINDAYSKFSTGFHNNTYANEMQNKSGYTDWQTDKIWLPSFSEVGWTEMDRRDCRGLWRTTNAQRGNATNVNTLMRTGHQTDSNLVKTLRYDGVTNGNENITSTYAIRPAFHLNLAKAEAFSTRVVAPENQSKTYTGEPLGVEDLYSEIFLNAVDIEYYSGSTNITAPIEVGTYDVKYILKSDDYYWSDGTSGNEITKTFSITQKQLTYPSIYRNATQQYDGGNPLEFSLTGYDKEAMDFSWSDTYSGVNFDGALAVVSATNVGKYEFAFTLKDTKNYAWVSTPKLEIEVEKAQLIVDRITVSGGNNTVISGTKSGGIKVDVYIDANGLPKGSDTVPIVITATHSVLGTFDVSGNIDIGV
ncbi:MAG: hypothetical protein K2O81_06610, partial [Clostridia bacterium]|nr:hypothetical protein [Clostridia bacterium]